MSDVYLTRIRLEQYRSFRHLDIRLADGPGVLVVQGSNGIGKSSLFDGLEWALTDKIDHFRGADGVKKVGSYLCRWRKGGSGPSSVTMNFSGDKSISRILSSREATESVTDGNIENISEFLKDETWTRNISGLSRCLLLTHFLGQSTVYPGSQAAIPASGSTFSKRRPKAKRPRTSRTLSTAKAAPRPSEHTTAA